MPVSKFISFLYIVISLIIVLINFNRGDSRTLGSPPPFRSGGPADIGSGETHRHCGSTCHTSFDAVFKSDWISSDIPLSGYLAGQSYIITISINSPGVRYGFQSSVQDDNGKFHGTLVPNDSTFIYVDSFDLNNIKSWISQLDSTNAVKNNIDYWLGYAGSYYDSNYKAWSFEWIAPNAGTGTLNIFASMVTGNGDRIHQNDSVFLSKLSIDEGFPSALDESEYLNKKEMIIYPNPVINNATLKTSWYMKHAYLQIFDIHLNLISSESNLSGFKHNFNRDRLNAGIYIVRIVEDNIILTQKILVLTLTG